MNYEAELTIIRAADKDPVLALSALRALRKAEQAHRISGYAHPHQVRQFNHLATKAKQKALKKIYQLVSMSASDTAKRRSPGAWFVGRPTDAAMRY